MRPTGSPICGAMSAFRTTFGGIVIVGPTGADDVVRGSLVFVVAASFASSSEASWSWALASCRPVPQSWNTTKSRTSTPAVMRTRPA